MNILLHLQQNELTEYHIYSYLAKVTRDPHNASIIKRIAAQEASHYDVWKTITKQDVEPNRLNIFFYTIVARLFGLSFGLKLMEGGEERAQAIYTSLAPQHPELLRIITEEQEHEQELLNLINTKALEYVSSVILGLNDALVELTGALIGFTLALHQTHLIGVVGLITGLAASLSMASASYLAARENNHKEPFIAGLVTGGSYSITTILLVVPYFLYTNPWFALIQTLVTATAIIAFFNFYTAVTKNISFKKRFLEMFSICVVVGTINFIIAAFVRKYFGL